MTEQPIKITKLKVGLTVFVGLVIFFVFIVLVGTDDFYFTKTYNLYISLDNVSGLVKGAPVTLGGLRIGNIDAIDLIPTNDRKNIRIKLRVQKSYQNQITTSSVAEITGLGILGDKFVYISIGKPGEQPLGENSFLPLSSGVTLEELSKNIAPGIEDFNKTMSNIRLITDSISRGNGTIGSLINRPTAANELSMIMSRVNTLLTAIQSKDGSIGKLLRDKELYSNLTEASSNLKSFTRELNSGNGTLGKLMKDDSLYNSVNKTANNVNRILSKFDNDSTVVNGLLNDKKMYGNLNSVIKDLNKLIIDLKEHPDKYVRFSIF